MTTRNLKWIAGAALVVLSAGCGTSAQLAASGTTTTTEQCWRMDLHAMKAKKMTVPVDLEHWRVPGADKRSFTADVTALDLTKAGINSSPNAPTDRFIVVVSHGSFAEHDPGLPTFSQGVGEVIPGAPPTTVPPRVEWVIYIINAQTHQFSQALTDVELGCTTD